ncbi:hypothetical protein [Pseudomonas asturiensis]|nr:hypothetical protein [Pseudomonas asturiensis]
MSLGQQHTIWVLKEVDYDFPHSRIGEHARNYLGKWNGSIICDDFAGH